MKPSKAAILEMADETLVRLGRDAERRQERRATRRALTRAATITALAGAGAAAVVVARKALRPKKPKTK